MMKESKRRGWGILSRCISASRLGHAGGSHGAGRGDAGIFGDADTELLAILCAHKGTCREGLKTVKRQGLPLVVAARIAAGARTHHQLARLVLSAGLVARRVRGGADGHNLHAHRLASLQR